ncbi:glycosyltransferase family 4 protein [Altererythrobacter arenosus]|uniref:Glycosyltransferase family 4 protein n=1 Tax=Altererythrobacter arenosus TaxID=3032592 RepID=A0ABY8FXD5_9SPHN|nr:glycosyltransferase family 4 protein [Altererythrobacter sp. CAU 1644]WFL78725.1 glycosyltransferase family 4 protein [Altererythrobacter sp. CAU 1644]
MRIAIVADVYPPMRSSGAVQLRDLSRELVRQAHEVTMLVAAPELEAPYALERNDGVSIVRLRTLPTRDMPYLRRLANELSMPFAMRRNFVGSPCFAQEFDAIVWYSPTIFHGPFVRWLKRRNKAPSYLIIRDVFPQWAADTGLIGRGPAFRILDSVAHYQYRSADIIGVQTPGNLAFFERFRERNPDVRFEVLKNWLAPAATGTCSIDLSATRLAGRKVFVYAGNMGVAQQMDKLLNLAIALRSNPEIGFLFVGRGSEAERVRVSIESNCPENTLFFDEIDSDEIPALYKQCHVGMISLDSRHRTHNIPGKFLTYMQAGLPVLASINAGNDLEAIVAEAEVGRVSVDPNGGDLEILATSMLGQDLADPGIAQRCRTLFDRNFSAAQAATQITDTLSRLSRG